MTSLVLVPVTLKVTSGVLVVVMVTCCSRHVQTWATKEFAWAITLDQAEAFGFEAVLELVVAALLL